jgi:hypothetical protein
LFRNSFGTPSVSQFAKKFKKLIGGIEDSLTDNLLHEDPHALLREFIEDPSNLGFADFLWPLIKPWVPMRDHPVSAREAWFLSHITQTRFLPPPNRSEVKVGLLDAQLRLLQPSTFPDPGTYSKNRMPSRDAYGSTRGLDEILDREGIPFYSNFRSEVEMDAIHSNAMIAGELVGRHCRHFYDRSNRKRGIPEGFNIDRSHLSLSGSACLEFEKARRKEGDLLE